MAKHFQVPFNLIEIKPRSVDPVNMASEKISFLRFATLCWLDDARAYSNERGEGSIMKMRRWQKVIDKFEAAKQGDWISLEDEDYAVLKKIVESPVRQFSTPAMLACMPYADAVLDAKNELPVVSA